jgi:hypothetical protein
LEPELQIMTWQLIREIEEHPNGKTIQETVAAIKDAIAAGWEQRAAKLDSGAGEIGEIASEIHSSSRFLSAENTESDGIQTKTNEIPSQMSEKSTEEVSDSPSLTSNSNTERNDILVTTKVIPSQIPGKPEQEVIDNTSVPEVGNTEAKDLVDKTGESAVLAEAKVGGARVEGAEPSSATHAERNGSAPSHRSRTSARAGGQIGNFCRWVNRLVNWNVEAIALGDDELCARRHLETARKLHTFCASLIKALEARLSS